MMKMHPASISVVLADDLPLFLDGLEALLQKQEALTIVGKARNGAELVEVVAAVQPQVVITDIQMPACNGIVATRKIKEQFPETGVIGLTMFEEDHLIVEMLEAGARGYILKNTSEAELVEAAMIVSMGGRYYCNSTSLKLSKMIAKSKTVPFENMSAQLFSEKEIEIIRLICQQYASKQIAPMTNLSAGTVENYRHHIMEKTGARNVVGIVVYAIQNGIFKP